MITVALSIRQPWAFFILRPDLVKPEQRALALRRGKMKDVENRVWRTEFRGPVLIHAGKTYGRAERDEARLVGSAFDIAVPDDLPTGGIVGVAEIVDCVDASDSPWFLDGGFGFVLRNARPLPFQPLPGRLGFFNVRGGRSFTVQGRETH